MTVCQKGGYHPRRKLSTGEEGRGIGRRTRATLLFLLLRPLRRIPRVISLFTEKVNHFNLVNVLLKGINFNSSLTAVR